MKNQKNIIEKTKRFEVKHKIISFLIIFFTTILITRVLTSLKDPNIIIKGFELHHFYYGLILLIIVSIIMLFKKGSFKINLPLTAIAIGLIIDELAFISGKIRGPIQYSSTLSSTIIISIILLLIIEVIFYYNSKNKN